MNRKLSAKFRRLRKRHVPQVIETYPSRRLKKSFEDRRSSRPISKKKNISTFARPHKTNLLELSSMKELSMCLKNMETTAQFDLWMRMIENNPFNLNQLRSLRTAIDDRIKLDIISGVPYEIALYIMSFLSPKDLCQAAQTCRSWRTVCEDNRLWREKCKEEGLLDDQQAINALFKSRIANSHVKQEKFVNETLLSIPRIQWREAYLKHVNILRNWHTRRFDIVEPFIAPSLAPIDPYSGHLRQESINSVNNNNNSNNNNISNNNNYNLNFNRNSIDINNLTQTCRSTRQTARRSGGVIGVPRLMQVGTYFFPKLPVRDPSTLQNHVRKNEKVNTSGDSGDIPSNTLNESSSSGGSSSATTTSNDNDEGPIHLMQLRCHEDSVITCLQFNPRTNTIVSGSDDQTLKVWSSETGRCINTLEGHTGGVWSSQLSPDDLVISGSTDRTLKVWDAHSGSLLHTLYGHTSTVRCLALNGDFVVSGSRDTTLRLWDISYGICVHVFLGHSAAVRCVEFKNDTIVSGAYDHVVMVWDALSGNLLHALERHNSRIYSLQFDGRTIASGSLDTTICIWDVVTGKLRHHLEGHQSLTSKLQLRGNILVSANADSYCKVWDINTGACLQTLGGENKHTSAITSVYFNNRHVVTSSDDGTVKLWDIKTGQFIRNLVVLPTASRGGVVWRLRASYTKLICAVGSRTQTEDTHLLVLDFSDQ